MLENIRLSFVGIISHKMRSFLTMLGIIIGIAAIIAIVSTITGTNKQIEKNIIGSGSNNVILELYKGDEPMDFSYNPVPSGIPEISDQVLDEISSMEDVKSASVYKKRQDYGGIFYKSNTLDGGVIYGVSKDYFKTCNMVIKKGRGFTQKDFEHYNKVAVIDEDAAKTLFQGENAVGKTIEVKKQPYKIVGIVTEKDSFQPTINTMDDYYTYSQEKSGKVFVSDATWPIIYQYDEPQQLLIKVTSTSKIAKTGKEAAEVLNSNIMASDSTIKYKSENLLEQAKQIQQLSQSTNMMLICIAGISLLVGGIGVMNIMLVSVTERTSEIGLKKAIGARKGVILAQFLTESVVLTSLGGIIGVIVGIALAEGISKFNGIPVAISIPAAVFAVLFSMVIGIVFGLLPSYKAANLDPIDALRRE
ncbi:putative ABC transport system permease protein [Lachnospiraceae bacterium C7]|nr:putative ABC transport system permease protein [Lachnospiraceae bacterium C7]